MAVLILRNPCTCTHTYTYPHSATGPLGSQCDNRVTLFKKIIMQKSSTKNIFLHFCFRGAPQCATRCSLPCSSLFIFNVLFLLIIFRGSVFFALSCLILLYLSIFCSVVERHHDSSGCRVTLSRELLPSLRTSTKGVVPVEIPEELYRLFSSVNITPRRKRGRRGGVCTQKFVPWQPPPAPSACYSSAVKRSIQPEQGG